MLSVCLCHFDMPNNAHKAVILQAAFAYMPQHAQGAMLATELCVCLLHTFWHMHFGIADRQTLVLISLMR